MLETSEFVSALIAKKYTHLCVVPCSFAKNLINEALNRSPDLVYFPCANEGIACSVAAGLSMAGMKPIVVVQSSGLTNMGSAITSLLKPYSVKFPIIVSWRSYSEGDSEIQHAHLASELPALINAYGYSWELLDRDNIERSIFQISNSDLDFQICVLQKDTFSEVALSQDLVINISQYPPRSEYLKALNEKFRKSSTKFVGTTGNTAREMFTFMCDTENFYMAGNMGGALGLGLGAALGGNTVIVCGGDAEFVMHLGGLTTAGRFGTEKDLRLLYILFDNESNKSTGGQNSFQGHINYIEIAKASSLQVHDEIICSLATFENVVGSLAVRDGVTFLHVKCSYDLETPRPPLDKVTNTQLFKSVESLGND